MLQSVQENISTCLIKEKYLLRSCPKMGINILQRLGNFLQDVLQLLMRYIMTYKIFLETLHVCLRNIKIILCWFSNLSNADIVALQKALNKIPGFDKLTEDGIYGEKTSNIYDKLISSLIHGTFPSVAFINPLQSHSTGVWANAKITKAGESFTQLFMDGTSWPIFRADKHNYKGIPDFPHINVEAVRGAPDWQKAIVDSLDHRELSKGTYDILKNFDNTAKIIKAGSRVLLVAGIVVDAIELGSALQSDLNDADQKLGKTTARASISIIGSWGGGALGAKAGAYVGAGIGTAILPGVGTLVGGVVGGLILGVAGSAAGSALGEWVVDITDIWE